MLGHNFDRGGIDLFRLFDDFTERQQPLELFLCQDHVAVLLFEVALILISIQFSNDTSRPDHIACLTIQAGDSPGNLGFDFNRFARLQGGGFFEDDFQFAGFRGRETDFRLRRGEFEVIPISPISNSTKQSGNQSKDGENRQNLLYDFHNCFSRPQQKNASTGKTSI